MKYFVKLHNSVILQSDLIRPSLSIYLTMLGTNSLRVLIICYNHKILPKLPRCFDQCVIHANGELPTQFRDLYVSFKRVL